MDDLKSFLNSYDFLRLGQAISSQNWPVAMFVCNRMEKKIEALDIDNMKQNIVQVRMAILHKNVIQGKNILAILISKRVAMLNSLSE